MSIETTAKILIVDDDSFLRDVLAFALGRSGFHVIGAADPATALNLVAAEAPALVILDVNLEPWDGFDLLDELRRRSDTPVIMLTQRSSEQERVRGLECGADDYITKPFSHHELRARIGAVLRRSAKPPPSPTLLTVGPLRMDLVRRQVMKNGLLVRLRAMEFKVLQCLMERPGLVVSRGELLARVWGYDPAANDVLRTTVGRLRGRIDERIGGGAHNPRYRLIHNEPGVGYLIRDDRSDA